MEHEENKLDFRRFIQAVKKWKWIYVISIIVFTGLGVWLSVKSLPKFTISGSMLIGEMSYDAESKAGGMAQMMKTFSVGGFSGSTVDNEILILSSHDVMLRTVKKLGLNRTYYGKDTEGNKAMLYKDKPIRVEAPAEYFDTLSTQLKVTIKTLDNGKHNIKVTKGFFNKTIKEAKDVVLPMMLETDYGNLNIMPTDAYQGSTYNKITVVIKGNEAAATLLYKTADIHVADKLADVIDSEIEYPNEQLGIDIINGLMAEYNAKRLDRLHDASEASIEYYDERIAATFIKLQEAEQKIADYQRSNDLMGIDSETGLLVGTANENKKLIIQMNNEITFLDMVLRTLRNRLNTDVIIPQMESMDDPNISAFNNAILQRRELRRSATDDNKALHLLNERIELLRDIVIENSEKRIAKMRNDVKFYERLLNDAENRLDDYPNYVIEFKNLVRDREYQNSLYQYLVNQRENSVLQMYSKTNLGFVFQHAYVKDSAGLLSKLFKPAVLFVFSLFAATFVVLVLMYFSKRIKDPLDVAFMHIDSRCYLNGADNNGIINLRSSLLLTPLRRIIYCADFTGSGNTLSRLAQSLMDVERSVEIVKTENTSNESLLTPEINRHISETLDSTDYVLVQVPDPDHLQLLEPLTDVNNACLTVTVGYDNMPRNKFKEILKGQIADKVYTIIQQL